MSRRKERPRQHKKAKKVLSSSEKRRPYVFSNEVKKEAKKRSGKKGRLEVHHRYPISLARYHSIAPVLIKSIANAVALPHDEHLAIHSTPRTKEWWDKRLQETKEIYIGGLVFLLEVGELGKNERIVYDIVLGEQRKEIKIK